jgi:glutamate racemase
VLVLATPVTVSESRFAALLRANSKDNCEFIGVPCHELAFMVESGRSSEDIEEYLRSVFAPYREEGFDGIVLGCTHYPLVLDEIKRAAGEHVSVFDGSDGTARHTKHLLEELSLNSLTRKIGTVEFISSDGSDHLEQFFYKTVNKGTK